VGKDGSEMSGKFLSVVLEKAGEYNFVELGLQFIKTATVRRLHIHVDYFLWKFPFLKLRV
jgi:hypothetical protein